MASCACARTWASVCAESVCVRVTGCVCACVSVCVGVGVYGVYA